jgi:hypothetical protein
VYQNAPPWLFLSPYQAGVKYLYMLRSNSDTMKKSAIMPKKIE